jgi:hypothetical protein
MPRLAVEFCKIGATVSEGWQSRVSRSDDRPECVVQHGVNDALASPHNSEWRDAAPIGCLHASQSEREACIQRLSASGKRADRRRKNKCVKANSTSRIPALLSRMAAAIGVEVADATAPEGVARRFRNNQDMAINDNGDIDADQRNNKKMSDHCNNSIDLAAAEFIGLRSSRHSEAHRLARWEAGDLRQPAFRRTQFCFRLASSLPIGERPSPPAVALKAAMGRPIDCMLAIT